MLIKLDYRNHLGNTLKFGEGSLFVNSSDLYDFQWDYTSRGQRVTSLSRKKVYTKTLPAIICASTYDAAAAAVDNLIDFVEVDNVAQKSGCLIINGYSYRCYIHGAKHSGWALGQSFLNIDLAVISDGGVWTKDYHSIPFNSSAGNVVLNSDTVMVNGSLVEIGTINDKKYPYEYPYRYTTSSVQRSIIVPGILPMAFRLSIYGACVNPSVTIGGKVYMLTVTLTAGERIVIDGVNRTITKIEADGTQTNAFDTWRDMGYYIFEPLQAGENIVFWNGDFSFYITPVEERSTPRWA